MGWYALAYTRVYEVDKTAKDFFRVAKDIYHWIWKHGWDVSGKYRLPGSAHPYPRGETKHHNSKISKV